MSFGKVDPEALQAKAAEFLADLGPQPEAPPKPAAEERVVVQARGGM
jgi:hypothetical protein